MWASEGIDATMRGVNPLVVVIIFTTYGVANDRERGARSFLDGRARPITATAPPTTRTPISRHRPPAPPTAHDVFASG